jgi:hypothetical protein
MDETKRTTDAALYAFDPAGFLVPTLRVGTHVLDALRPVFARDGDAERPYLGSHAERGNQELLHT